MGMRHLIFGLGPIAGLGVLFSTGRAAGSWRKGHRPGHQQLHDISIRLWVL